MCRVYCRNPVLSVEYASLNPSGLTLMPPTDINGWPSASWLTSSTISSGCDVVELRPRREPPAMNRILAPFHRSHVVKPSALQVGNRHVRLFDVRQHLAHTVRSEIFGGLHHGERVSVLRFQMSEHLRRGFLPHPAVVIFESLAMKRCGRRFLAGVGWLMVLCIVNLKLH